MAWIREEKKPGKQQYLAPLLLMPRGESFLPIYAKARGDSQAGLCASKEKDPPGRPAWLSQNRLAPGLERERERERGLESLGRKEKLPRIKRGVLIA